ncbi:SMP-30/gluconolactonase/LRE family protein [Rhizobium terrae]|uniref:SMP-30/gluconolactonase/LRE family protein n=1 Tax=Rhizobium terrae TaxID=2171756 RepID=UPI0029C022FF|nr:SMP-30/gluconolactonase/LRE family protein [Rhizobium terrae]
MTRTTRDGHSETVVDSYQGRRLNSPNDVVVCQPDGSIWFTDPPYGIESDYEGYKADREQDGNYVYRFDPVTATLSIAAVDFDRPNGLAFSPDGRRLYIADSGASLGAGHPDPLVADRPHHICVFDVTDKGSLCHDRVFAIIDAGLPDGLRVDRAGRVWTSAWDGVWCYGDDGSLLVKINVPEITSNLVIDERSGFMRFYITASTSVYYFG